MKVRIWPKITRSRRSSAWVLIYCTGFRRRFNPRQSSILAPDQFSNGSGGGLSLWGGTLWDYSQLGVDAHSSSPNPRTSKQYIDRSLLEYDQEGRVEPSLEQTDIYAKKGTTRAQSQQHTSSDGSHHNQAASSGNHNQLLSTSFRRSGWGSSII